MQTAADIDITIEQTYDCGYKFLLKINTPCNILAVWWHD